MIEEMSEQLAQNIRRPGSAQLESKVAVQRTLVSMRKLMRERSEPKIVDHLTKCLEQIIKCVRDADEEGLLSVLIAVNQFMEKALTGWY